MPPPLATPLECGEQSLFELVVVGPSGLRVAAKGGEDLGVLESSLLGGVYAVEIAPLRDATLETRPEHVSDAASTSQFSRMSQDASVKPKARAAARSFSVRTLQPRRSLVSKVSPVDGAEPPPVFAILPRVPSFGALAQGDEAPPGIVGQLVPRSSAGKQPDAPVPRLRGVTQLYGREALFVGQRVPRLLPDVVARRLVLRLRPVVAIVWAPRPAQRLPMLQLLRSEMLEEFAQGWHGLVPVDLLQGLVKVGVHINEWEEHRLLQANGGRGLRRR
eukprot:CAMPEP_0176073256 /NCGR_PEP_ID=MMETSP0120_2-20121206/36602_1 /TAXON_ID=160619 /ORGANISM="Kryptoperidinium foliaceum, Strain CCMP 1326" /LENGTH=274 /DNA_ID=CAMNT_0017406937 /DNA_START=582 /DNA_END=1405 /DNA_ORIENTATION=-